MDELIVRVSRAIACTTRLRILSSLARVKEKAPSALADELRLAKSVLSSHLRVLEAAGLMTRRRSGVWSYCVAGSAYDERALSGQLATWLRELLRAPKKALQNCRVLELCNSAASDSAAALHALIFEAATAFTNVRRLQILRRLAEGGEQTVDALTTELHMSAHALSRHMGKLVRRGFVVSGRCGRRAVYRLADGFKTPIHARMSEIMRSVWGDE